MKHFSVTMVVKLSVLESSCEKSEIAAAQILKDAISDLPIGATMYFSAYETPNQTDALKRSSVNFDSPTMS